MTEPTLQALACNNPIAGTAFFERGVKNLVTNLYGFDSTSKKTKRLHERNRGIAGVPVHNSHVKENNKRGSSHIHAQFHGGISPALLADIAGIPELEDMAMHALNTVVQGELPLTFHIIAESLRVLRIGQRRDAAFTPEAPQTDEQWADFAHDAYLVVANRHTHQHQETCTSGKKGKTGCRMSAPWAHGNHATTCRQLHLLSKANDDPDVGEQFRCTHCYAGGALRTDPPNMAAVRAADTVRDIAYTVTSAEPRDGSVRRDSRALAVELRRRSLPLPSGTPSVLQEFGIIDDSAGADGPGDALAALIRSVRESGKDSVDYPEGAEGDKAAAAELLRLIDPLQPLGQALRRRVLHLDTLLSRLQGLAADPPLEADESELHSFAARAVTLRHLLKVWTADGITCRNGIVADFNLTASFCTRANTMPILLGAGDGSKAVAMYQVRMTYNTAPTFSIHESSQSGTTH